MRFLVQSFTYSQSSAEPTAGLRFTFVPLAGYPVGSPMLLLSRSLRRKLLATLLGAAHFMLALPGDGDRLAVVRCTARVCGRPSARLGSKLDFVATAYCRGQTTASGSPVQCGNRRRRPDGAADGLGRPGRGAAPRPSRHLHGPRHRPEDPGTPVDLYMWSCTRRWRSAAGRSRSPCSGWAGTRRTPRQGLAKPGNTPLGLGLSNAASHVRRRTSSSE